MPIDTADFHPDLQVERIEALARAVADVRRKALVDHNPALGDTAWGLGCRCYERTVRTISEMAKEMPWLEILELAPAFQFRVGCVPLRFYTGAADAPHTRTLRVHYPELRAHQLLLAEGDAWGVGQGNLFRLAIETDEDGDVDAVFLVKCDADGNVFGAISISIDVPASAAGSVAPAAEAVDLGPPPVGDAVQDSDEADGEAEEGEDSDDSGQSGDAS